MVAQLLQSSLPPKVREQYEERLKTAEEAIKVVQPGMRVGFPFSQTPIVLADALATYLATELADTEGIEIGSSGGGAGPYAWLQPGFPGVKKVVHEQYGAPTVRAYLRSREHDFVAMPFSQREKGWERGRTPGERRPSDVLFLVVSPPDQHGYVSVGASWYVQDEVKHARYVLAEVTPHVPRFYGQGNLLHVTQFHALVEHNPDTFRMPVREPSDLERTIAGYVSELIDDGDTLQTGIGLAMGLVPAGALDGKHDLGWHSEGTSGPTIDLIEKGVINGSRKSIDTGKAVGVFWVGDERQIAFCHMNPAIEARPTTYVHNLRTIAQIDNMVAINNALAIDLTGQITADSLGHEVMGGTGGQTEFHIGALQAKNGRAITLLESTALEGRQSRIMPALPEGTIVTVPRMYADIVVTEFGVARLWGKSARERALELINIAHPNHRDELRFKAKEIFRA